MRKDLISVAYVEPTLKMPSVTSKIIEEVDEVLVYEMSTIVGTIMVAFSNFVQIHQKDKH